MLAIVLNMSLNEVESILEKRSQGFVIIGQINITTKELEIITKKIRNELKHVDQDRIVTYLWIMYPLTCLVLTVHYAIHLYDGNYWGNFREAINLQKDTNWKKMFYREIKRRNLIDFGKSDTQKYVSNVLGHAGVPKQNVSAFISNVIIPAIEYGLSALEVVEQFRYEENNEIKMYHLYKSVKDFIKFGDKVSLGFINRCMQMWREHKIPFIEYYEGFLPNHVLVEFDKFIENNTTQKPISKYYKINRPKMKYDPANQHIYIKLSIQKNRLGSLTEVEWVIQSDNGQEIVSTYSVKYESRDEEEFIVEENFQRYLLKPDSKYKVTLRLNKENRQTWIFNTSKWMLFNADHFEYESDLTLEYERIILIGNKEYLEKINNGGHNILVNPLFGMWQGYYEIEIYALRSDEIQLDSKKYLNLCPQSTHPYLSGGEKWENLKHTYSVYSVAPYAVIPKNSDSYYKINVLNPWLNQSITLSLNEVEGIIHNNNGDKMIPLKQLFNSNSFGYYEVSLIGSLGLDIKFKLIYLNKESFNLKMKANTSNRTVKIIILNQLELNVLSPSQLIPRLTKDLDENLISFEIHENINSFIFQLRNKNTEESIIIKYFTSQFGIYSKCGDKLFNPGTLTNKENFDLAKAQVILNLENPSLFQYGKTIEVQFSEKTSDNDRAVYKKLLAIGRKHIIPFNYFEGLTVNTDRRTIMYKINGFMEKEKPLVLIDSKWKIENIKVIKCTKKLLLTWSQNYNPKNVKLYIWSLHDLSKAPFAIEIPYGSRQVSIPSINCNYKHGYYLFEWRKEDKTDPFAFFINQSHPKIDQDNVFIFNNQGDKEMKHLAHSLLLYDESGQEYERNTEEIISLFVEIKKWGKEYTQSLLKGYDYCCDFGIQNIDQLIDIYQNFDIDKVYLELFDRLSGYQEWDDRSFLKIIDRYKSCHSTEKNALTIKAFGSFSANSRILLAKNEKELTYIYQSVPFHDLLIKDFSIEHAIIEFLILTKTDSEYNKKVTNLIESSYDKLIQLYRQYEIELKLHRKIKHLMSCRITREEKIIYSNLPSMMAYTALLTRSLANFEYIFTEKDRIFIRNLAHSLMNVNRMWFIHDLSFLTMTLMEIKSEEDMKKERRRKYEYPSFSWKR